MKKKIIFLAIIIVFILAITSCAESNDYSYIGTFTDLPENNGEYAFSYSTVRFMIDDGRLGSDATVADDDSPDNRESTYLVVAEPETDMVETISLDSTDDELLFRSVSGLPDGGFICTANLRRVDISGDIPENEREHGGRIIRYTSDGSIAFSIRAFDIDPELDENFMSASAVFADEKLYILADDTVYVLDGTAKLISKLVLPRELRTALDSGSMNFRPVLSFDQDSSAIICCGVMNGDALRYKCYPINDDGFGEAIDLPDTGNALPLIADGFDVFYYDEIGLYGMNKGESPVKLFDWLEVDLSRNDISFLRVISAERILVITRDNKAGVITTGTVSGEPKITVRIAYEENRSQVNVTGLTERARSFNLQSEKYRIELCAYNSDDNSSANEKLRKDMISGNMPDIVLFAASITPEDFLGSHAFVNLYEFIDKDEKYTRDAFVPCVLEPMETENGELPYITADYYFETLAGKKSVLGEREKWNMEEFEDFISTLKDDQYLIGISGENEKNDLFGIILSSVLDRYVDYAGSTFDLDGLTDLLQICEKAPVLKIDNGYLDNSLYVENIVALRRLTIANPLITAGDCYITLGNEEISYIGFPTDDTADDGTMIVPGTRFAISNQSANPEAAWDFICWYLDEQEAVMRRATGNPQTFLGLSLPVTRSSMELLYDIMRKVEFACTPVYTYDAEGHEQLMYSYRILFYDKNDADEKTLYQEEVKKVVGSGGFVREISENEIELLDRLTEKVTTVKSTDYLTMNIILEEASAYFAGAQTLDRTAEIISDRVKTRLAE